MNETYTVFVIGIVTTGFNGLYINNKHHQIIDISCRLLTSGDVRYDRHCYLSDDMVIHPLSVQIHGFRTVQELKDKRAVPTLEAIEGVYAFIHEHTVPGTIPMVVSHQVSYVYTVMDLIKGVPENIVWVCSKRAIKTLYPEMEEFRWELVSINKKIQETEDHRLMDTKIGQSVRPMHLDTDFTPYRLKNIMRYFYRNVQSFAYKTITTASGVADNISVLIVDVVYKKTQRLDYYQLENEYKSEHRFAIRLKDIYGIKRSFIEMLSAHINDVYLRSPGFEKDHCVNPNTISIGDLVVFCSFSALNTPSNDKMAYINGPNEPRAPTSEWYTIAMELERLIRIEFRIFNEELIVTLMSYVLGISISETIRSVYPSLAGLPSAFYPMRIKDEAALIFYRDFGIRTIMDLENEYLLYSLEPEKLRSFMNKIRVRLYAVEEHELVDSVFNSNILETIFRQIDTRKV